MDPHWLGSRVKPFGILESPRLIWRLVADQVGHRAEMLMRTSSEHSIRVVLFGNRSSQSFSSSMFTWGRMNKITGRRRIMVILKEGLKMKGEFLSWLDWIT